MMFIGLQTLNNAFSYLLNTIENTFDRYLQGNRVVNHVVKMNLLQNELVAYHSNRLDSLILKI